MSNNRIRNRGKKKEISLMTLLANEATADSRKLLKKYGQSDATNYNDLEAKLADLYFKTDDKLSLEKELANIHPHKNWLIRNIEQPVLEVKKEEVIIAAETPKKEESKSNFSGENCSNGCPHCYNMMLNRMSGFSNAEGKNNRTIDYVGVIGTIAIVGALFYVLSKNKN